MARDRDISKPLGLMAGGLVSPIGYALYALSVSRPFFALGLFLLVSAIATTAARALLGYRMRALLAGLECVEPYDNTSGQLHRLILRAGIIMAAPAWLVLQFYQQRVEARSHIGGTISFYPDISQFLIWGVIFALFLVLVASRRKRVSNNILFRAILLFGSRELACIAYVVVIFFGTTPRVVLTPEALVCDWRVPWADISNLSLADGASGKEYALLSISPKSTRPQHGFSYAAVRQCEITRLHADYHTVYRSMRMAWQGAP